VRLRVIVAAFVAIAAFAAVPVQQAVADTSPIESVSTSGLPSGYAGSNSWNLNSSACGSESCVAVGSYEFAASHNHGLIVPIQDGIAGTAAKSPLPAGAQSDPTQNDRLTGVSCWSSASCVAVGDYYDTSGNIEGFVVPISGGVVGTPQEVAPPDAGAADPAAPNPYVRLNSVSCAPTGVCVAVGHYSPVGGGLEAMAVPINDGVAASGVEVPPPPDHTSTPYVELSSIGCGASGLCAAVGYYNAGSGAVTEDALVVPITDGVPGAAVPVTALPINADPSQGTFLTNVACPASGTCTAIGYYADSSSNERDLVVPVTGGVAASGLEAPAPSDAAGTSAYPIQFNGLACQSTGACVAAGSYVVTGGSTEPVAIPVMNGVPASAVRVMLPADREDSNQNAELNSVACPATGPCLAVGDYRNGSGNSVPMTASFNGGSVGAGTGTAEPGDVSPTNPFALLDVVGCTTFSCAATGDYSATATEAAFVLSAQAPLAINPASLPAGTVGTAYSQPLSVTGAWGVYSNWSVTSGSMPAGLSLNTQTGAISGTPTAVGTSTFTVQLSSTTGVPTQVATQSYSLAIAAVPPTTTQPTTTQPTTTSPTPAPPATPAATPKLSLAAHSATVKKNRFGLKLSCLAAPCRGSVKLQIRETYTVKHGKKKVRKHRIVTIASAQFSLAAGQTRTLTVTLNGTGRRALAAEHRLSATVLDTMVGVKRTLGQLTLKQAPVKHKRK
jgi:hypothetical protein